MPRLINGLFNRIGGAMRLSTMNAFTKLRVKVITRCWKMAEKEGLTLRRGYRRELKEILRAIRFNRKKNAKLRNAAMRWLKAIANVLLGDIGRKLSPQVWERLRPELGLYSRAVNQKRTDKAKISSLHEPEVFCMAKGKERKKHEFGNKVCLAQTITSGIIVGTMNMTAIVCRACWSKSGPLQAEARNGHFVIAAFAGKPESVGQG